MIHIIPFWQSLNHLAATSTVHIAAQRFSSSWRWYIVRAAGFVAAGLLVLLTLSGIGQVTGLIYRFIEPIKVWAIHKALAYALCASIAVHIFFIFIDHFVPFSLVQILVPFVSKYNNRTQLLALPIGSLAVSFGVLAMYGVIIVVLSSLGWIDSKKKAWKLLHYLSYLVAVLVFLHALYTGTDLKHGLFRMIWIVIGLVVMIGIASRLWRAGTLKKGKANTENLGS